MDDQITKINLEPLKRLGLTDEQIQSILMGTSALLQEIIDTELAEKLPEEIQDMIEEKAAKLPLQAMVAYSEAYKIFSGRELQDFSNKALNELIELSAKIYAKQSALIFKVQNLKKEDLDQFVKLVEEENFEEAEKLVS
jgi:hypothetical protein